MACGGPGETWHKLPCPLTGISGNYCSPWQINGIAAQHVEATPCHTLAWYQPSRGHRGGEVASKGPQIPTDVSATRLGAADVWHKWLSGGKTEKLWSSTLMSCNQLYRRKPELGCCRAELCVLFMWDATKAQICTYICYRPHQWPSLLIVEIFMHLFLLLCPQHCSFLFIVTYLTLVADLQMDVDEQWILSLIRIISQSATKSNKKNSTNLHTMSHLLVEESLIEWIRFYESIYLQQSEYHF